MDILQFRKLLPKQTHVLLGQQQKNPPKWIYYNSQNCYPTKPPVLSGQINNKEKGYNYYNSENGYHNKHMYSG